MCNQIDSLSQQVATANAWNQQVIANLHSTMMQQQRMAFTQQLQVGGSSL